MRKIVGVDLDTTLNNLEQVWLAKYNEKYNDSLTVADMANWDVTTYVKPECGKDMYKFLWEPGLFRDLGIKPSAASIMAWLNDHYEVFIVTSAHPNVVADKWAWVEKHLPFIDSYHFVPLHPKDLFRMDYLIDDGPHNIEGFRGKGILMDMPYNQYLKNRHIRCRNWLDVFQYFKAELNRDGREAYGFVAASE
ncbi:5'-3'-deoxyribonucleotidase (plasmid) [Paenibacillus rhizovicinus]|uniref:5'-3'-deoxyribonucleotidase n=1 Tax=Paenibacillus rhizovicinus TaxID=2704463 RepID=A0A6C0PCL6_9BACL|nr:5'-3'-deoxyribonucleotidase [Paenibacillus rhizovicinus]QHW35823.1 5'-3'-deoxyribonucleotidase [Paenibacillus rhizovicinus]